VLQTPPERLHKHFFYINEVPHLYVRGSDGDFAVIVSAIVALLRKPNLDQL